METYVRPMSIDNSDFDAAKRALEFLKISPEQATCLKVRPVKWDEQGKNLYDGHVSDAEYTEALKAIIGRKKEDLNIGGWAKLMEDGDGKAILIKHETGPELILIGQLALATASVGLARELFLFLRDLLKALNESTKKRKNNSAPAIESRPIAGGISLELRLKGAPMLVGGISLPVAHQELLDQFLRQSLERAVNEVQWEGFTFPTSQKEPPN